MNIRLPAAELTHALTGLGKIIATHSTLPVLKGVRVEADMKGVTFTATDLDSHISYRCQNAEVIQEGVAIVADAKRLKTIVERAKNDEAILNTVNQQAIEVRLNGSTGDRQHILVSLESDDWPQSPPVIPTQPVDKAFLDHYRTLLPFASTDVTRAILGGVYLDMSDECHRMVSTDGRRLCAFNSVVLPIAASTLVPHNKFMLWPKLEGEPSIGVHPESPYFRLQCGAWDATVRVTEGSYPNWRQIVPGERLDPCFVLDEKDVPVFQEACRTLPGTEDSSSPITLMTGTPHPKVAGHDMETDTWSHQVLTHSQWNGPALGICLNRHFLMDAIKAGFRHFEMLNELSPVVSRMEGNIHVLMPVRGQLPEEIEKAQEAAVAVAAPETEHVNEETPSRKEIPMIQPKNENGRTNDQTPDLWTQYQAVKDKARELNSAIAELGQSIKGFHKDQKTVRVELDNARGVLAKLQSINI